MQSYVPKDIITATTDKVKAYILRENLLPPNKCLQLAVSGGVDSVVLTDIMLRLAPELGLNLYMAHLNHCLRGEYADRDEAFTRHFAKERDIPIIAEKIDIARLARDYKQNVEEIAREKRHMFLMISAFKQNCEYIATAHHMQDNAESMLLNLARGTGLTGLEGIIPKRKNLYGAVFIRPLLCLSRPQIEAYAQAADLAHVHDHTNDDTDLKRNRMRHVVLPELTANFNPNVVKALDRLSQIVRSENQWADDTANQWLDENSRQIEHGLSLPIPVFKNLHIAMQRRVLRKAILRVKYHLLRVTQKHIEAILTLMESPEPLKRLEMPDRIMAVKRSGELEIICSRVPLRQFVFAEENPDYEFALPLDGVLDIHHIAAQFKCTQLTQKITEIPANALPNTVFFDINNVALPLYVRSYREGDIFKPLGFNGHIKLRKFFNGAKVPAAKRKSWPLVCDAHGQILWVAGLRLAQAAQITGPNPKLIKVEALLY